jgi:transcription termination/antitermination protein NusG
LVRLQREAGTKGGEALPETVIIDPAVSIDPAATEDQCLRWHVLWTRSNFEQLVHDQLVAKGFEVFLPTIDAWARRGRDRVLRCVPLFRGYLFVHHAIDKASYLEVCKARGLVRMLGERWDRLEIVPDTEIEAIQTVLRARLPVLPFPYLREGQRVRITSGPMADVEGILVRCNPNKGLLVISINLLRRSVAVQVDCTLVEAA